MSIRPGDDDVIDHVAEETQHRTLGHIHVRDSTSWLDHSLRREILLEQWGIHATSMTGAARYANRGCTVLSRRLTFEPLEDWGPCVSIRWTTLVARLGLSYGHVSEMVMAELWQHGRVLTIGMIGGMSWESSAQYYRLANELVRDRLGGLHSAQCVLLSVDFAEIEQLQMSGRWDEAGAVLAQAGKQVEAAGADLVLLCTNTMHKIAAQVEAAVNIPLLHLADATADAVQADRLATVGLLGTAFTMEQDFYRERLAFHGLTVLVPETVDRQLVHTVIYDELCHGVVTEESRAAYLAVINRLIDRGAQGVVLGCTEIELLISQADAPVPVFPTTRLHVEAAVEKALTRT